MTCYKDITFCKSDCAHYVCFRFYGPEQHQAAISWCDGDSNASVAMADFSEECEDYQNE